MRWLASLLVVTACGGDSPTSPPPPPPEPVAFHLVALGPPAGSVYTAGESIAIEWQTSHAVPTDIVLCARVKGKTFDAARIFDDVMATSVLYSGWEPLARELAAETYWFRICQNAGHNGDCDSSGPIELVP